MLGESLCADCKSRVVDALSGRQQVQPERVLAWARVFDWVLAVPALFWGGVYILGLLWPDPDRNEYLALYGIAAVVGLVLPLPPALCLSHGRRWAYYYQVVTLTLGTLLSVCTLSILSVALWLPAGILLSYWLRPEISAYCEGRVPRAAPPPL
jgi:hypothetical protein